MGDFNNDGGLDVLISVNDEAPVLLRNEVGKLNHWLGVKLVGKKCNADAVGALITYQAGDLKRSRLKVGGRKLSVVARSACGSGHWRAERSSTGWK